MAVIGSSLQRIARAASPEMGSTDKTAKNNIFEIDLLSNSRRSVELDRRREKPADYRADASTVAAVVRETRSAGGMTAPPESSSENKRAGNWEAGWENVQAVESRRSDVEAAAEAVKLSRLTIVPNKRDGGDDAE